MKRYGQAIVILLSMLMVCATACGGGSSIAPTPTPIPTPHAPTIGYLPEGWQLTAKVNYGQFTVPGEPTIGFLKYLPETSDASLYIQYGDIPDWALDQTDDVGALLNEFIIRSNTSCSGGHTPDEIGMMTFCNSSAAYARFSLSNQSVSGIVLLCIKYPVMIAVDAVWTSEEQGNDVMAILGNVSY
jgi:hypothetical protein